MNGVSKILNYEIKSNLKTRLLAFPIAAIFGIVLALIPAANPDLPFSQAALGIFASIISVTVTFSVLLIPPTKMMKTIPMANKLGISRKDTSKSLVIMDILAIIIGSIIMYLMMILILQKFAVGPNFEPFNAVMNLSVQKETFFDILISLTGVATVGILASLLSEVITFNPIAGSFIILVLLGAFGVNDYIAGLPYAYIIILIAFVLALILRHYTITKTDLDFK